MSTGSIFISHSSRVAAIARELVAAQEAGGLACWISGRDVATSANYQEAIVAAIRGGRAMVVLVFKAANTSEGVNEIDAGSRHGSGDCKIALKVLISTDTNRPGI